MVASAELIVSVNGVRETIVAVLQKSLATMGGVFVGVCVAVDVAVAVRVAVVVGVDVEVCAAACPTASATQTNPTTEWEADRKHVLSMRVERLPMSGLYCQALTPQATIRVLVSCR
jgi:hypothetical protein